MAFLRGERESEGGLTQRLGPVKDALRFFLLLVLSLTGKVQCWGGFICVNQSSWPGVAEKREDGDGGGRTHSTDWILGAGYVTSSGGVGAAQ